MRLPAIVAGPGAVERAARRRSPRDSPQDSRDDDSRAGAPRRAANDDDDDEYMGWPDARTRSRGHAERKDRG